MRIIRWIGVAAALMTSWLAAGCTKQSGRFCCTTEESCAEFPGQSITPCTDPAQPYCDDLGEYGPRHACAADPRSCTETAQCAAPLVCDVGGSNLCVACTPQEPAACAGTSPVCGDDHACRACRAHAECPASGACLPDGACADPAQVAYVQPGGTDNPNCSLAEPCLKVASALQTARPFIKLTGTTDEGGTLTIDNRNVTLLADPGAKLVRSTLGLHVEVKGSSQVTIEDLEISGGLGPQGIGISLPAGNTAALTLRRVKIANNTGGGIAASGGSLTLAQSTVASNTGGGIAITGAQFDITNSLIVRNGGPSSAYGGVIVSQINAGTRRFEFNTVAQNQATSGITPGVLCSAIGTALTLTNTIVYDNGAGAQVGGANCAWTYSDIGPDTVAGMGNLNANPLFVTPMLGDFHLQAGSPAKDAADPTALLDVDLDGDPRPQGAARDMGADELR